MVTNIVSEPQNDLSIIWAKNKPGPKEKIFFPEATGDIFLNDGRALTDAKVNALAGAVIHAKHGIASSKAGENESPVKDKISLDYNPSLVRVIIDGITSLPAKIRSIAMRIFNMIRFNQEQRLDREIEAAKKSVFF